MGCGASKVTPKVVAPAGESAPDPRLSESAGSAAPLGVSHYKGGKLGVIRLDYDYEAAPGDIDCWKSYDYEVVYRCVPGLTFAVCQSGKLEPYVEEQLREAVSFLIDKGVQGITGDCGFMMYLQDRIREMKATSVPVFMSALAQLPAVECAFGKDEKIAIFTANGKTLAPMRDLICSECGGLDTNSGKFVIVGCESVPGFEAVELGEKVVDDAPGEISRSSRRDRAQMRGGCRWRT